MQLHMITQIYGSMCMSAELFTVLPCCAWYIFLFILFFFFFFFLNDPPPPDFSSLPPPAALPLGGRTSCPCPATTWPRRPPSCPRGGWGSSGGSAPRGGACCRRPGCRGGGGSFSPTPA